MLRGLTRAGFSSGRGSFAEAMRAASNRVARSIEEWGRTGRPVASNGAAPAAKLSDRALRPADAGLVQPVHDAPKRAVQPQLPAGVAVVDHPVEQPRRRVLRPGEFPVFVLATTTASATAPAIRPMA